VRIKDKADHGQDEGILSKRQPDTFFLVSCEERDRKGSHQRANSLEGVKCAVARRHDLLGIGQLRQHILCHSRDLLQQGKTEESDHSHHNDDMTDERVLADIALTFAEFRS
jgi:hypothetical protein